MHKTTLLACAAALAMTGAAIAAPQAEITTNADHSLVTIHRTSGTGSYTPPLAHKPNLPSIYNNFATLYPKGVFNASNGASISGVHTLFGQVWLAAAFTPTANATVQEVDVAASFINGAKNVFLVSLYSDASGVPGTKLWSKKTALPTFGDCCAIVALHDNKALAVTAGTQYWVTITTLPVSSTSMAAWNLTVLDQVDSGVNAQNRGTGWQAGGSLPNFAFGIYGK